MVNKHYTTRRRFLKCPHCETELELWIHLMSMAKQILNELYVDYVSFEDKEKEQPSE